MSSFSISDAKKFKSESQPDVLPASLTWGSRTCSQAQRMSTCLWLSSACSSFQEGVRPSELEEAESVEASIPRSQGRGYQAACHPAAFTPRPHSRVSDQWVPDKTAPHYSSHWHPQCSCCSSVANFNLIPFLFWLPDLRIVWCPCSKSWVFLFVSTLTFLEPAELNVKPVAFIALSVLCEWVCFLAMQCEVYAGRNYE